MAGLEMGNSESPDETRTRDKTRVTATHRASRSTPGPKACRRVAAGQVGRRQTERCHGSAHSVSSLCLPRCCPRLPWVDSEKPAEAGLSVVESSPIAEG
jgi:hypothetical protein